MKKIFTAAVAILLLSSSFAEENHHKKSSAKEKSGHVKISLALSNGKKWPVDQILKENMDAIHQEFKIFSERSKSKMPINEGAYELSAVISASAKNIISNCKMEQKQDEAFHVILADLFAVAADLKKLGKSELALKKLTRTLKSYSEYFDHSLSI